MSLERRGKHIIIHLSIKYSLIIHLKMTGHLLYRDEENEGDRAWQDPMNQFIRHQLFFTDGSRVDFSDMRKFARIRMVEMAKLEEEKSIRELGIDALSLKLTTAVFLNILRKRKNRSIAEILLEQNLLAGIGNIYRSESLFRSGSSPFRKAAMLTAHEAETLLKQIRSVLREATRLRGTSDGDFRDTAGRQGAFQKTLFVYGRQGKKCKKCGTIVERKKLGARSVFYCPSCQKI